jgi:hypothetical protein
MSFRDDHEAAVQRIAALEDQLARIERERDRFRTEAEAARTRPSVAFRDDHEAAVQRIAVLENQLSRTEQDLDRYRDEAEAAKKLPPGSSAEKARIAVLEMQLAAALEEGAKASEALALIERPREVDRRVVPFAVGGLLPLASGAAIALAVGATAAAVGCFVGMAGLVYWAMRRGD